MVLSVCDSLSDLPEWAIRDEETLSIAVDYAIMSVFPIAVALMNEGKRVAIVPLSHLRDFTRWPIHVCDRRTRRIAG